MLGDSPTRLLRSLGWSVCLDTWRNAPCGTAVLMVTVPDFCFDCFSALCALYLLLSARTGSVVDVIPGRCKGGMQARDNGQVSAQVERQTGAAHVVFCCILLYFGLLSLSFVVAYLLLPFVGVFCWCLLLVLSFVIVVFCCCCRCYCLLLLLSFVVVCCCRLQSSLPVFVVIPTGVDSLRATRVSVNPDVSCR